MVLILVKLNAERRILLHLIFVLAYTVCHAHSCKLSLSLSASPFCSPSFSPLSGSLPVSFSFFPSHWLYFHQSLQPNQNAKNALGGYETHKVQECSKCGM